MDSKKRVKLTVSGDVQGVSFRYFAKDIAKKMGITGWAENQPDGSVIFVIEGDTDRVDEFTEWCRQGSPMSTVENVEVEDQKYKGEFKDFQIK
ncbi:MAG: acylphosphatase [Patescibacteria group bacterium]|nr:acylphosphatase [Patescibacteria group bacterium]MCL5094264.1 acylphosphatase [Patescibacteria group bacterium]